MRAGGGLWAIGDVTGHGAFTHVSMYQSAIALRDILGEDGPPASYHAVPHATFTDPEVGGVGLTERQARDGRAHRPDRPRRRWSSPRAASCTAPARAGWSRWSRTPTAASWSARPRWARRAARSWASWRSRSTPRSDRHAAAMIYAYPTFHRAIETALADLRVTTWADVSQQVEDRGRSADDSDWLDRAIRIGLVTYGVVHLLIAWLAVQLALGDQRGQAASQHRRHAPARAAAVRRRAGLGGRRSGCSCWSSGGCSRPRVGHRDEEGANAGPQAPRLARQGRHLRRRSAHRRHGRAPSAGSKNGSGSDDRRSSWSWPGGQWIVGADRPRRSSRTA